MHHDIWWFKASLYCLCAFLNSYEQSSSHRCTGRWTWGFVDGASNDHHVISTKLNESCFRFESHSGVNEPNNVDGKLGKACCWWSEIGQSMSSSCSQPSSSHLAIIETLLIPVIFQRFCTILCLLALLGMTSSYLHMQHCLYQRYFYFFLGNHNDCRSARKFNKYRLSRFSWEFSPCRKLSTLVAMKIICPLDLHLSGISTAKAYHKQRPPGETYWNKCEVCHHIPASISWLCRVLAERSAWALLLELFLLWKQEPCEWGDCC